MTEWGVVGVIIALLGLFMTVIKPLLTLNTSIVRLTDQMEHVSADLNKLTDENSRNHKHIHERIDKHAKTLTDHAETLTEHERRLNEIDTYHKFKEKQEEHQHEQS